MGFIRENIIRIDSNQSMGKQQHGYLLVQKGSPIVYSSEELRHIKPKVDHNSKYKILSSDVCRIVRSLRINKRQTQRGRKPQNNTLNKNNRTVNCRNLVHITTIKSQAEHDRHKNFTLALGNVQSIKNKDDIIAEFLHDTKSDVIVVTETWLSPDDNTWKSGSEIVKEGYGFNEIHQCKRRGGGLALLHKTNLKVKRLSQSMSPSMELAVWKVTSLQMSLHIVGVYRPPDKSIPDFLDLFTEYIADLMAEHENIVLVGDFNIHINHEDNPNAVIFLDTMTALGLHQHADGPTHRSGNCLDLVFTEELSRTKVKKCIISDYLSDHAVVLCELTIPKQDQIRKRIKYRNTNGIDINDFAKDLVFRECDSDDLEAVVANFEEVVSKAINTHAPFIERDVTIRRKRPWFNDNIRHHKRKVRSLERLFKQKRTYSTWLEFNSARKVYKEALTHAKIACYLDQIKSSKGDTKKLYNLVYGLMGDVKSNPLPDHTDDAKLAEEFADFFIAKIQAIRDDLEHHEKFKTNHKEH